MVRRSKEPRVSAEKARQWLQRLEEKAESPPDIASADGYDVRTVRKYIDRAREERDVRQSKQTVLRGALEKHYTDLVSIARKIRTEVMRETPVGISAKLREDPLYRALKKHLSQSRLWRDIDGLQALESYYRQSMKQLRDRIRREALSSTTLSFASAPGEYGIYEDGFSGAMLFYLQSKARGDDGPASLENREIESEGGIRIVRGAYALGFGPKEQAQDIEHAFDSMMKASLEWEEYVELSKLTGQFMQVRSRIEDELLKVIHRRVVHGKCDYCPF